jgi:hypothetical protein
MKRQRVATMAVALGLAALLAGCGGISSSGSGLFSKRSAAPVAPADPIYGETNAGRRQEAAIKKAHGEENKGSRLGDLFGDKDNPNTTVEVNKYIWAASLDVLNFLPIESVDPFTGVIVTGYGVPPGGGRAYRATIYVQDPALDARSLKVAMQSKGGGTVSAETIRAVEDAILTRARQLRVQDSKL